MRGDEESSCLCDRDCVSCVGCSQRFKRRISHSSRFSLQDPIREFAPDLRSQSPLRLPTADMAMNLLPPRIQELLDDHTRGRTGSMVFILRGIPGCGKSSFAQKIGSACVAKMMPITICCADEWFFVDGRYLRSQAGLSKAHQYSRGQFAHGVLDHEPVIIVDNTNLATKDYEWYVKRAYEFGYQVVIVEWEVALESCALVAARSVHLPVGFDATYFARRFELVPYAFVEDFSVEVIKMPVDFEAPAGTHYYPHGYHHTAQDGSSHGAQVNMMSGTRGFNHDFYSQTHPPAPQ